MFNFCDPLERALLLVGVSSGILRGKRSNSVNHYLPNVMQILTHQNRIHEYPFNNEEKIIPLKNCILGLTRKRTKLKK